MIIQFLSASMPLTKSYVGLPDGTIQKSSYPHAYEFTSHAEDVTTLQQFYDKLVDHANAGHCLLKGSITKPLVNESRAGSTTSSDATQWLCLDVDGLPETITLTTADGAQRTVPYTFEDLMRDLGLADVSYVLQRSASYKISDNMLRGHIFLLLDKPVPAPVIKQWLIHLNHTVSVLRGVQALTKTGNSLTWALDITACQNDKLLYITAPVLKNIKNPLGRIPRIELVSKPQAAFTFPSNFSGAKNQDVTDKRIAELRAEVGLPKKKMNYKALGGHTILAKPDSCDITEMKQERGFVYFNLNGGDSWAYYHPEDNPKFIHNFKGEPVYLTSELLPEYWASLQEAGSRTSSDGLIYLAFCDRLTGVYWKGTYDQNNDVLDIQPAKTLVILTHFMIQNGMVPGDHVPEWDIVFDPQSTQTVDFDNRVINTFQLSEYMKREPKHVEKCPPTIFKFVHHALGSDVAVTEHFLNWLAFILQRRTRTLTAWVLHGTQGTGKGVLMAHIIRPIFGAAQTTVRRMEEFKQPYNAYMKQCFIVAVDEVQTKALNDESGVIANIKNWITEPTVTIRQMYATPAECPNYTNWLFLSNKTDVIQVDREDRRINVARYQREPIYSGDKALAQWPLDKAKIDKELQAFHDYLYHFKVDDAAAATVIETEDRDTMIDVGENSVDTISTAILEGDMEYLLDQLPTDNKYQSNAQTANRVEDYKAVLKTLLVRTDALTGKVNISRDELQSIYAYCVGKMPESPNKFTALLKHHRVYTKKVWVNDKAVYGISTTFKDVAEFDKYLKSHWPQSKTKAG